MPCLAVCGTPHFTSLFAPSISDSAVSQFPRMGVGMPKLITGGHTSGYFCICIETLTGVKDQCGLRSKDHNCRALSGSRPHTLGALLLTLSRLEFVNQLQSNGMD
ncbi:hypothetical protein MRB53_007565 [Persea americana]|uniref:Uncharacterized protein n=1 Tax=Persea americana TaxID=3435 RepID=A0ACC2MJC4_PERAE|nr:hypothetical protein MRB53_007565 [Persea americana]